MNMSTPPIVKSTPVVPSLPIHKPDVKSDNNNNNNIHINNDNNVNNASSDHKALPGPTPPSKQPYRARLSLKFHENEIARRAVEYYRGDDNEPTDDSSIVPSLSSLFHRSINFYKRIEDQTFSAGM